MKRILALVLMLVLLTGCAGPALSTETTEAVKQPGELTRFPEAVPEGMEVTQLLETRDGLLLSGSGRLVLLSREDLSVLAECDLKASRMAFVQVLEDRISVADPEKKTVTFLDLSLSVLEVMDCPAEDQNWLVSTDGSEVYTLSTQGIHGWTPEGSRELLRCRNMSVLHIGSDELWLGAVGMEDLMNRWYRLDLTDGTVTEPGERELLAFQLGLRPQSDGTRVQFRGSEVCWYDADGHFLSSMVPEEGLRLGRDFVRVEERGWFFLAYAERNCQIMLWNPAPGQGEDIVLEPEQVPQGEVLPRELYDRAEALSQRFDLEIRIGDRAARDYKSYDSGMLTDPELTAKALDVLEEALAVYPEGFFTQLKYGNHHSIRIELVDGLTSRKGHDVSTGASAVTFRRDRYCLIVLDAQRIQNGAVFHEFSHIIDDRMAFEARLRPEALYSEEGWMALQPEGFRYADSYQNIPEEVTEFYDSGYFARKYACISATEDRAVTMEDAMLLKREVFEANPRLLPKLQYYCDCIRDSFDTTNWPQVLPWEQLLLR